MTTKVHLACHSKACPVSLALSVGQEYDSNFLGAVVENVRLPKSADTKRGRPRCRPQRVTADKGYSYPKRRRLRARGINAMIPERRNQRTQRQKKGHQGGRPCAYDKEVYRQPNLVERCVLRLKQFRRVATRYDRRASSYLAFITLTAIIIWLR